MLTYADVSPNGNDADLSVDVTEVEYKKKKNRSELWEEGRDRESLSE
jgi:hypothetical protein